MVRLDAAIIMLVLTPFQAWLYGCVGEIHLK